jgi:isoquinoline 1-oxidoreductase alpha subunit
LLDGVAYSSCTLAVDSVGDREITTIEGLDSSVGQALKEAWIEEKASQCGYCQPGQIIKAASLLTLHPNPTDEEIDEYMTNICRCGTYQRIRAAIKRAALSIGY